MRARIISRLQRGLGTIFGVPPNALNEGQDYIPATTRDIFIRLGVRLRRSMRARIISRLQLLVVRSYPVNNWALNEGQDYIPATTSMTRWTGSMASRAQ